MELPKINVRVAQISELRQSYELDAQGMVLHDELGQPVVKAQWREVTFDDGRLVPELFGPFKVFGPADRFAYPVGTPGVLSLRMQRKKRLTDEGAYMSVDIVDFQPE